MPECREDEKHIRLQLVSSRSSLRITFVSVHGLEVHGVSDDVVLVRDAVAAERVAANARNVERFAAVVALDERNHLRCGSVQVQIL